ncbi:unnamed protein product [Allacma fusca]|uniref:Uncharacterized protein n=1 Tax=Allacma fusca TaxID=39272 RepID=A0A8J2J6Q7_9HEXA|nr:unnamed protein product [Allacma fusca]
MGERERRRGKTELAKLVANDGGETEKSPRVMNKSLTSEILPHERGVDDDTFSSVQPHKTSLLLSPSPHHQFSSTPPLPPPSRLGTSEQTKTTDNDTSILSTQLSPLSSSSPNHSRTTLSNDPKDHSERIGPSGEERKSKKVDFNLSAHMSSSDQLNPTVQTNEESGRGEIETREENKPSTPSMATSSTPVTGEGPARKGLQSFRRRSRSPAGSIMREIRKMSLASQDAREEKKKATAAASATGMATTPSGPTPTSKKAAKKLSRRRKRKEEEYTDKDRAAAVTLGSRDIKQSLKAKKKRERKLRISIDLLHSEDFLSAMLVVEAAYQMRVKKQTKAALSTLNKALELQPMHKAALVARSQCHLKLGDAASALRDAQTSFDGNETYIMGLYQYAEALYNLGQFEKALIAYHRGYRIRKVENFRIGIQKSQEAIRRAIGDRSATQIEDLDQILPLIDELEASANLKMESGGSSIPNESDGVGANNASAGGGGDAAMRSGGRIGSKHKTPSKSRARWVAREVLGQMYFDKDYLTKFLLRPDIRSDQGASQELRSNATEALNYLEIREQFWRQQNPMYARKQGLNFNNKYIQHKPISKGWQINILRFANRPFSPLSSQKEPVCASSCDLMGSVAQHLPALTYTYVIVPFREGYLWKRQIHDEPIVGVVSTKS